MPDDADSETMRPNKLPKSCPSTVMTSGESLALLAGGVISHWTVVRLSLAPMGAGLVSTVIFVTSAILPFHQEGILVFG